MEIVNLIDLSIIILILFIFLIILLWFFDMIYIFIMGVVVKFNLVILYEWVGFVKEIIFRGKFVEFDVD